MSSLASSGTTRRTVGTSTAGKLNALADNFNNFYGDLEEETTTRKQAEEQRVARIERELGKIERVIATETKRRIEASKALQVMFEAQLVVLQKDFKEQLRSKYEPLQMIELIHRVERLEKVMEEEKRDREIEIQKANRKLHLFNEHEKQFEVEKVTRLREAQTLKRVGDEIRCSRRSQRSGRRAATC